MWVGRENWNERRRGRTLPPHQDSFSVRREPMTRRLVMLCLAAVAVASPARAQGSAVYVPETDPLVRQKLEQWQDLKLGLLMHWGTYSQWGIVESWSLCSQDEPWCKRSMPDYSSYKKAYE